MSIIGQSLKPTSELYCVRGTWRYSMSKVFQRHHVDSNPQISASLTFCPACTRECRTICSSNIRDTSVATSFPAFSTHACTPPTFHASHLPVSNFSSTSGKPRPKLFDNYTPLQPPQSTTKRATFSVPRRSMRLKLFFLLLLFHDALCEPPSEQDSPPYTTRYGPLFLWHALSAILAWALLSPISHITSLLQRRNSPPTSLQTHRASMITVLLLTLQTYTIAIFNAKDTPPQHAILATALLFCCILQACGGLLRPENRIACSWRVWWRLVHRAFGVGVMLFGGWVVYHSMWVFGVSGWPRAMVEAVLVLGFLGIAIAQGVRMLDEGKHVETHDVEIGGHEREGLMDSEEAKEMHLSDR